MSMPVRREGVGKLALVILLLCSAAWLQAEGMEQAGGPAGGYRIAGKVVSSTSGVPVSRARLTIASVRDRDETRTIVTGDDGGFEFTHLDPGKYSLEAARPGYISSAFDQHERYSTAIVTGGEADSEHLVFRLTPQAVITGKIFDEAGEPVRHADVALYRQDRSSGVGLTRQVAKAPTDDRGSYEFAELSPGNYFVSANAKPWYALHTRAPQGEDGAAGPPEVARAFKVTYPTTYYADVTDSDEATPIPLRGGERLSIDLRVSPVAALHIIIRMAGGPEQGFAIPALLSKAFDSIENIVPQLLNLGPDIAGNRRLDNVSMPAPGTIELWGVPAGKYTVVMPENGAGKMDGAIAEFNLTRNGQELDLASGERVCSAKFVVHILGEDRLPEQLLVALQNAEHKTVAAAPVDANGEAELLGIPPGKYVVLAATPAKDYAVVQITANGNQTSGHTIDIAAGSAVEGTVSLVGGTGGVEGFAKRGGKGVPGAMVVLVPRDPAANSELFRRDQSDLDGSFSLATVVPGEYTIVAIEHGWDLDWSQPGVIAHYVEHGQRIVVNAGAQARIRLSDPVEVQRR
jgi:protocatechuate 3,4-dioxygenase beta subunit